MRGRHRANATKLTNTGRRHSMFSVRIVRPYFLSSFIVTLCYCFVKHAVLVTRFDSPDSLLPDVGNLSDRQPLNPVSLTVVDDVLNRLRQDVKAGDVILPLSYSSSNEGHIADSSREPRSRASDAVADDTASRQNKESEAIIRHFGDATGDGVASSTTGKEVENDELSSLFGTGCKTDKLGLPAHVARHCAVVGKKISDNAYAFSSQPSSPSPDMTSCTQLTCRNVLNDVTAADKHSRIAAEFTKSFPFSIPTDGELAAIDKCDVWRTRYGFDDMQPVSFDEVSFPLAFNVLTHHSAHQVIILD